MTHLEQQIYQALLVYEGVENDGSPMTASICKGHAQVAAKIAVQLAEKAYHVGRLNMGREGDTTFKQFIQDYE